MIMDQNKIIEIFRIKYGLAIDKYLAGSDYDQDQVKREYERAKLLIELYCKSFNYRFDYDKLSDSRKEIFDTIVCEQIYYKINNFDFSVVSGVDLGTNSVLSKNEIDNRVLSPVVKEALKTNRFLYRGVR